MEEGGCHVPRARAAFSPAAMKADRKRLKAEKTDLVSQMQQLYATLESREEQLRDFIRNYEQHRKVSAGAQHRRLVAQGCWQQSESWFVIGQQPTKAPAGLLHPGQCSSAGAGAQRVEGK